MTDLLLKSGASVFFPCRLCSPTWALSIAIENYLENKTEERAKIVQSLLCYGAGIGFKVFNKFVEELLDDAVIIGSNFCILQGVDPIKTANEFKKRVDINQYAHWQMVFERVRSCPLFQQDEALLAEITEISDYINEILDVGNTYDEFLLGRGSPITAAGEAHEELVSRIMPIVMTHPKKFRPFLEVIQERDYSKALREACNSTDPEALELVKILLTYKARLPIQVNEQAGDKNRAAIHYAALKNNQAVYELLVQYGADVNLKDADDCSAEEYQVQQEPGSNLRIDVTQKAFF